MRLTCGLFAFAITLFTVTTTFADADASRIATLRVKGEKRTAEVVIDGSFKVPDYSIRALSNSKDEMGILVDTFNRMIAQVELNDQRMKAAVDQAESAKVANM